MRITTALGALALSVSLVGCSSTKTETMPEQEVSEETAPAEKPDAAALYQAASAEYNTGTQEKTEGIPSTVVMYFINFNRLIEQ